MGGTGAVPDMIPGSITENSAAKSTADAGAITDNNDSGNAIHRLSGRANEGPDLPKFASAGSVVPANADRHLHARRGALSGRTSKGKVVPADLLVELQPNRKLSRHVSIALDRQCFPGDFMPMRVPQIKPD